MSTIDQATGIATGSADNELGTGRASDLFQSSKPLHPVQRSPVTLPNYLQAVLSVSWKIEVSSLPVLIADWFDSLGRQPYRIDPREPVGAMLELSRSEASYFTSARMGDLFAEACGKPPPRFHYLDRGWKSSELDVERRAGVVLLGTLWRFVWPDESMERQQAAIDSIAALEEFEEVPVGLRREFCRVGALRRFALGLAGLFEQVKEQRRSPESAAARAMELASQVFEMGLAGPQRCHIDVEVWADFATAQIPDAIGLGFRRDAVGNYRAWFVDRADERVPNSPLVEAAELAHDFTFAALRKLDCRIALNKDYPLAESAKRIHRAMPGYETPLPYSQGEIEYDPLPIPWQDMIQ